MKKNIHPEYHKEAIIKCACGNVIKVGSTQPEMSVKFAVPAIRSTQARKKVIDSAGQVDRFKKRMEKTAKMKETKAAQKAKKTAKKTTKKTPAKVEK